MKTVIRCVLALVLGVATGSVVNIGIILGGSKPAPPPPGVDVPDAEGIAASIDVFEPKHFVVTLLAPAAGTLDGAFVAYVVASRARAACAWAIGVFFLAGGIGAATMIRPTAWSRPWVRDWARLAVGGRAATSTGGPTHANLRVACVASPSSAMGLRSSSPHGRRRTPEACGTIARMAMPRCAGHPRIRVVRTTRSEVDRCSGCRSPGQTPIVPAPDVQPCGVLPHVRRVGMPLAPPE